MLFLVDDITSLFNENIDTTRCNAIYLLTTKSKTTSSLSYIADNMCPLKYMSSNSPSTEVSLGTDQLFLFIFSLKKINPITAYTVRTIKSRKILVRAGLTL